MATEGKEKKRKAPNPAVQSDPPHKKPKKTILSDNASELKKKTDHVTDDVEHLQEVASASTAKLPVVALDNTAAVKSKKSRKRAADFLDEEGGVTLNEVKDPVVVEKVIGKEAPLLGETQKSKKPKKPKAGDTVDKIPIAKGTAVTSPEAAKVITADKPQKKKKKLNESVAADDKVTASANKDTKLEDKSKPVKTKSKSSTADFHANKIDQLLETHPLKWEDKKLIKGARKKGAQQLLTADGVNGVIERGSEEDVETTTADNDQSASMQAEAQHTVDQELEDKYGSGDESEDQGAALLAGFDDDDEYTGKVEDVDPEDVVKAAKIPELEKKAEKKLRKARNKGDQGNPGTVYVGRIPHGFYEHPMRAYFTQFGNITKLRLSRNRTTGASKHFAFIQFESDEVAKIVASSMDNYLMFGHILKCKYAPEESLHPDIWKGANKRYKAVPYSKLEKRALEAPKTVSQWEIKNEKEQKKREAKAQKMREVMGYEFEPPTLKSPGEVLMQKKQEEKTIESAADADDDAPLGALEPPNGIPKDEVAKEVAKKSKTDKKEKKENEPNVVKVVAPTPEVKVEAAKEEVAVPKVMPPAILSDEPLKGKKKEKKKKEKRDEEKVVEQQLASQLNGDAEPSTSVGLAIATVMATAPTEFASAFAPSDEEAVEVPAVVGGSADVKRRRKRDKKMKSLMDGGVALTADKPLTSIATVVTKTDKKETVKKPISAPPSLASTTPAVAPLTTRNAPETKAAKKEKSKKISTGPALTAAAVSTKTEKGEKRLKSDAEAKVKKATKKAKKA